MWWWVESHDAAMLLTPLNCVSLLTLVWHRCCTCGLGCVFSFLPQTGKRLEVNHVVVHQYLPYSVHRTGILVIVGEKSTVLEWPSFFRSREQNCQEAFLPCRHSPLKYTQCLFLHEQDSCWVVCICRLPPWVEFDVLCLANKVLNVIESICQRYFCFNPYGCRFLSIPAPMLEFVMNKRGNYF